MFETTNQLKSCLIFQVSGVQLLIMVLFDEIHCLLADPARNVFGL